MFGAFRRATHLTSQCFRGRLASFRFVHFCAGLHITHSDPAVTLSNSRFLARCLAVANNKIVTAGSYPAPAVNANNERIMLDANGQHQGFIQTFMYPRRKPQDMNILQSVCNTVSTFNATIQERLAHREDSVCIVAFIEKNVSSVDPTIYEEFVTQLAPRNPNVFFVFYSASDPDNVQYPENSNFRIVDKKYMPQVVDIFSTFWRDEKEAKVIYAKLGEFTSIPLLSAPLHAPPLHVPPLHVANTTHSSPPNTTHSSPPMNNTHSSSPPSSPHMGGSLNHPTNSPHVAAAHAINTAHTTNNPHTAHTNMPPSPHASTAGHASSPPPDCSRSRCYLTSFIKCFPLRHNT